MLGCDGRTLYRCNSSWCGIVHLDAELGIEQNSEALIVALPSESLADPTVKLVEPTLLAAGEVSSPCTELHPNLP